MSVYHALGKILYNKRESAEDEPGEGTAVAAVTGSSEPALKQLKLHERYADDDDETPSHTCCVLQSIGCTIGAATGRQQQLSPQVIACRNRCLCSA